MLEFRNIMNVKKANVMSIIQIEEKPNGHFKSLQKKHNLFFLSVNSLNSEIS